MAERRNTHPHNLPVQLTSFIGREREIAQATGFLSQTRLLTLTGAGGAGKTRLAHQVATAALEAFPDGAWVVDLTSLADPALVPQAVGSVLGVAEQPARSLQDTLVAALREKSLLLVLDNCEHLQPACAHLVDVVLRECQRVRIVATSREPLSVSGETLWRVPSMSVPEPDRGLSLEQLQQYEAVRLFVERARAVQPAFALTAENAAAIVQICHRLDGIPLAIELAAGRVKVLAVQQIAARLDDRFRLLTGGSASLPHRYQTLRAAMDWSYNLLAEQEKVLLRRLSVFAGGGTLDAAEGICSGDGLEARDILDLLAQLVDKSLIIVDIKNEEARYRLLETVRQYGRDRLDDAGEAARVRRRHRDWYLQWVEQADVRLRGPDESESLARVEMEHDNLRTALEWSKAAKDGAESELRLACALEWFWYLHGHWIEGRARLEDAIARGGETSPFLPKIIVGAARIAYRQGDRARARALCETGLAVSRRLEDKTGTGRCLLWLGILAMAERKYQQAAALLEESRVLFSDVGDKWWSVEALSFQGILAALQHDYGKAVELSQASLAISRETGNPNNVTWSLLTLGLVALRHGDYARAAACYTESLARSRDAKTPPILGCLVGLARVACEDAEHERSARLFGAAEAWAETVGIGSGSGEWFPDEGEDDRRIATARARLGEAAFAAAWSEGRAMTREQAVEYALAPQEAAPHKRAGAAADPLTAREREVAALVAGGLTNRQVAAKLVVTERTAETHVQNILNKLGFTSRAQIAAWAAERRLRTHAEG